MEIQLIQLIKDISIPAVIALFILVVIKPLLPLIVDYFRSKINGNTDITVNEKLEHIEINCLHTISETLERIERKMDKLDDIKEGITYIKARINGR